LRQPFGDGRVLPYRFHQLEVGGAAVVRAVDSEHGLTYALLFVHLGVEDLEAVGLGVERHGALEVVTGDPNVVDACQHAVSPLLSSVVTQRAHGHTYGTVTRALTAQYIGANPR